MSDSSFGSKVVGTMFWIFFALWSALCFWIGYDFCRTKVTNRIRKAAIIAGAAHMVHDGEGEYIFEWKECE